MVSSGNCCVSNCTIHSSQHDSLRVSGGSNNTIINCSIYTTQEFGGGDAVDLISDYNKFINCEIFNNRRFGIFLDGGHNTLVNCSVHDNREAGTRIYGYNNIFLGCNFYDNGIGFKIDDTRNNIILDSMIHHKPLSR